MGIIYYSVFLLALALAIGLRFPKARIWEWIDAIYYPLAICGVVLLFLESVNIRQLATLEDQRRNLSNRMTDIEHARPEGDAQLSSKEVIRAGGEILANISKLNRSCERTPTALPVCFVVEDLAPIVAPGEQLLLSYDGPEELGDVCDVASEIFTEMAESTELSGFLVKPVTDHYFQGLDKGFLPLEFESVRRYVNDLRPELEESALHMIEALNMSNADRQIMEPLYEATIQYSMSVLIAFDSCLRAPESIRSGAYAKWNSEMRQAHTELEQMEAELRQMRINANELNQAAVFRASYWPFLIIFALSLKFSKGVAALRKKHVGT